MTGTYHDNPFLNTITYNVEFSDGQVKEYGTNIIAENMLTQVDSDGYSLSLMDSIIENEGIHHKPFQWKTNILQLRAGRNGFGNLERMETTYQVER